ncbi:MAG: glycoside hydrolase family 3 C-terminal domain-containing protein [Alistipes senegalensis]|nr:glycoside hydrolase family 3 C-terminal domain-containing protein [Bacteroides cellulosilyticus]MCM1352511.1 glycoside hydrolase family 3 C-terminal domain-containing protein [Alistipes senegalensis]
MKRLIASLALLLLSAGLPTHAAPDRKKSENAYSPGMVAVDIATLKPLAKADSVIRGAIYADPSFPASERAADLIRRMNFEEKLRLTGGWNRFMIAGIPRLGVRPVSMADASQGIRLQTTLVKDKSTSFPGMLPLASTWNPALATEMSRNLAEECRALGVDILLGPGANIQRLSVGGRNFEYMGEDPLLTSVIAAAYVKGLQHNGIIATPKHFLGNDQDFCRHIANSMIDERTLREIYLLPWERMIAEAGCLGIMTGNNLTNGLPCPMNKPLITDILRREYGFKGMAMTDWQNTGYYPQLQHLVLTSGETLLMPENATFREYILRETAASAERKAEVEALLERMIYPTLYALFEMGIYDRDFNDPSLFARFDKHKAIAAQCAAEAMVLLKNQRNILPLKPGQRILLTGTDEIHSGTGSGFVTGYDHVSYEQGLRSVYGDDLICQTDPDRETIRKADVVLFRLNKPAGEGRDIPYEEPSDQLERLRETARLNKNVIVLINACNVMPMDWLKDVRGVVWCYFLGQERGTALAALLSGRENFSGKLPFTVERNFDDSPAPRFNHIGGKPYWHGNNQYKNYWLGWKQDSVKGFSNHIRPGETIDVPYSEGVFIGYRWYDKHRIPYVFPFGYGLSYTTFTYESIVCENRMEDEGRVLVTVRVKNDGSRAGKEIVQLYVSDTRSSVERPEKELKAFTKVTLEPGESKTVTLELDRRSFSFWDTESHDWKLEQGEFVLQAGSSSADLPLDTILNL